MKKNRLLATIIFPAGTFILMVLLIIGTVFATLGETELYNEQALLKQTQVILESSPTPSPKTDEIELTSTIIQPPTATSTNSPTVEETTTKTKAFTKTVDSLTPTITFSPTTNIENPTEEVCGPPPDWVEYTIQPGDNLYRISLKFRTTVAALKTANCLGNSVIIVAGEKLWVPNVATSTPVASYTPTLTKMPVLPSLTPTDTTETDPETSLTTEPFPANNAP
jgi:LysM repeat protein